MSVRSRQVTDSVLKLGWLQENGMKDCMQRWAGCGETTGKSTASWAGAGDVTTLSLKGWGCKPGDRATVCRASSPAGGAWPLSCIKGAWKITIPTHPSLSLQVLVSVGQTQLKIQWEGIGAVDVLQIRQPSGSRTVGRAVGRRRGWGGHLEGQCPAEDYEEDPTYITYMGLSEVFDRGC